MLVYVIMGLFIWFFDLSMLGLDDVFDELGRMVDDM